MVGVKSLTVFCGSEASLLKEMWEQARQAGGLGWQGN